MSRAYDPYIIPIYADGLKLKAIAITITITTIDVTSVAVALCIVWQKMCALRKTND